MRVDFFDQRGNCVSERVSLEVAALRVALTEDRLSSILKSGPMHYDGLELRKNDDRRASHERWRRA